MFIRYQNMDLGVKRYRIYEPGRIPSARLVRIIYKIHTRTVFGWMRARTRSLDTFLLYIDTRDQVLRVYIRNNVD